MNPARHHTPDCLATILRIYEKLYLYTNSYIIKQYPWI
jgi:hypothetical protein